MSSGRTIDYDEVLDYIGQFGKYQKKVFFWLWLISAAGGLAVVVFGFTAYIPNYRVRTECDGPNSTYYANTDDWTLPSWLNAAKDEENTDLALKNQDCRVPTVVKDVDGKCVSAFFTNKSKEIDSSSMDQLIIDREIMTYSLVEEYAFVCDRSYIRPYYSAIYMLGMLFGSYIFGFISDYFGRKKALMIAVVCVSLSGFLGAFCKGPGAHHGFAFLRFFTGMGGIGCFMVCFVLAVEHVGFKFTMLIGIAIEIPFALGEALLGIEALIFRDWQILQIVAYLPLIVLLGLHFVLPESTRWLITKGKLEEAKKNISDAAACNGRQVPDSILQGPVLVEKSTDAQVDKATVFHLFNTRLMLFRTINMGFQWFSVTMCYYGLTNASTALSGDAFGNFLLSCLIEIPGYFFCIFLMDIWGRRPILSFCQIISGVSCVIVGLISGVESVVGLQVFLSLIGKFGASASFAIVYVYTAEMFPTSIRNQAVGVCSLIARIGGIVSLLLDLLKDFWGPAPVFIMGCVATTAGFLALLFPETLGQKLPETMEDAYRVGEGNKRGICQCTCVSPMEMYKEELKEVEK